MYAFEREYNLAHGAELDSESEHEDEPSPQAASQQLADLLIDLKFKGKLSAKNVCLICWYGRAAGLTGAAANFALRPHSPSGHYNRHIKAKLNLGAYVENVYDLAVPGFDRFDSERVDLTLPTLPPHESLAKELEDNPRLELALARSVVDQEWSDAYTSNEVVRSAGPHERVYPLALYLDGVPFTKRDGLIGFFAYNLVSMKRHMLLTLRKSQLCRCGCQGWCTLWVVWQWLAWSFQSLADAVWPGRRHDGSVWGPTDAQRSGLSGQPLMKGALVNLKGDWAEIVHTWFSFFVSGQACSTLVFVVGLARRNCTRSATHPRSKAHSPRRHRNNTTTLVLLAKWWCVCPMKRQRRD